MPSEEDAGSAQANASGNTENPSGLFTAPGFSALAFAGGSVPGSGKLGPRAPLQPVAVWTGRAPGTNVADNEEPPARRGRKERKAFAAKAKPVASPAAQAFASAKPAAVMDDGKGQKPAASPAATLQKTPPLVKPKAAAKPAVARKKVAHASVRAERTKQAARPAAKKTAAVAKPKAAKRKAE